MAEESPLTISKVKMANPEYQNKYRYIRNISEEGSEFYLVLQYVAHFYTKIMKGQVRRDTPDVLIQYSRDWEYPWVIIKSAIQPKQKVLDCGSGFSPIPFILSQKGGKVYALDNEAMVCSAPRYALHCLKLLIEDIISLPAKALKNLAYLKPSNIFARNWKNIRKIWSPYLWGPISPRLLRQYRVNYQKGTLTNLPHEDDCFDVVSCVSVLEHMSLEDQKQGIREMARVVKKGGKLIITYDKEKDLTDLFIKESGMRAIEIVNFSKSNNPYNRPSVIGICLVK